MSLDILYDVQGSMNNNLNVIVIFVSIINNITEKSYYRYLDLLVSI